VKAARNAAAGLVAVLAAGAGVGWLYLLWQGHALGGGPRLREVLPLEHLARADAQPVLSVVLVWLTVGGAAGIALALLGVRRTGLAAGIAVLLVLGLTGAASDAVQNTQPVLTHLAPQLGRGATWFAAALVAAAATAARRAVT